MDVNIAILTKYSPEELEKKLSVKPRPKHQATEYQKLHRRVEEALDAEIWVDKESTTIWIDGYEFEHYVNGQVFLVSEGTRSFNNEDLLKVLVLMDNIHIQHAYLRRLENMRSYSDGRC